MSEMSNEAQLLQKINPDLFMIYRALMTINKFGGNGSIEIHLIKGKIKDKNGLYIKPGFDMLKITAEMTNSD